MGTTPSTMGKFPSTMGKFPSTMGTTPSSMGWSQLSIFRRWELSHRRWGGVSCRSFDDGNYPIVDGVGSAVDLSTMGTTPSSMGWGQLSIFRRWELPHRRWGGVSCRSFDDGNFPIVDGVVPIVDGNFPIDDG